jgi:3-hydroxybutyryl-CoA dehydrogenase
MATLQRIGIVGTGALGGGIAQVCAQDGVTVLLYDAVAGAARAWQQNIAHALAKLEHTN